jgi:hypothetical protein
MLALFKFVKVNFVLTYCLYIKLTFAAKSNKAVAFYKYG